MTFSLKSAALATAFVFGAAAAQAATVTIDFTDDDSYSSFAVDGTSAKGDIGTTQTWTATPTPSEGPLTRTTFDGTVPAPNVTGLTFDDYDGLGVVDDEISFPSQLVTIKFTTLLRITGLHFLDAFGGEGVDVYLNGEAVASHSFGATAAAGEGTGYLFAKLTADVTSISFGATGGNDLPSGGFANPDLALAGIDIFSRDGNEPEPVPLPAGGVLLLTALGGLGIARRRKARKAA